MKSKSIDVAVLGGGAAGLGAVREARRRGATAVLVNRGPLGGDCTFTGCVPSKTLIEASRAGASFEEAFDRARSVVEHIAKTESADVLRAEGVDVIDDEGVLVGAGRLEAGDTTFEARGVVLALGSRPALPPIPGLADVEPLTSDTLWDLRRAPASLAVIGGGAIGCELSQALARLGVTVTVLEMAPRLLPGEEPVVSAIVEAELRCGGVDVRTGSGVENVAPSPTGAQIRLTDGSVVESERVLVAVGRSPNSDRGGLEAAGLELDRRGHIVTADDLRTSMGRTYAAGDITDNVQLTHAADAMGRIAAGNILRRVGTARFRAERIPRVIYTDPEVAVVGLSESEAAKRYPGARVAELPLAEHDRAIAAEATNGLITLISAPRRVIGDAGGGRLVGATVVAERAGEMIAELTLALTLGTFIGRLAMTVHPYPSWSYAIPKTAAQFFTTVEGRTARPARP